MLARLVAAAFLAAASVSSAALAGRADAAFNRALEGLVALPDGPPGVIAIVQRGDDRAVHTAGVARLADQQAPRATDHMRRRARSPS